MLTKVLSTAEFNRKRMRSACDDFITATELADYLVKEKGLTFRAAHQIVGRLVAKAVKAGLTPEEITPEMLASTAKEVTGSTLKLGERELRRCLSPEESVRSKKSEGSPSPDAVVESLRRARQKLKEIEAEIEDRERRVREAFDSLLKEVEKLVG